jgi:hypothetical protein
MFSAENIFKLMFSAELKHCLMLLILLKKPLLSDSEDHLVLYSLIVTLNTLYPDLNILAPYVSWSPSHLKKCE